MSKISGAECALRKIFSNDFDFVIPSYQRPYAWTTDEAEELFQDLWDFMEQSSDEDEPYFLGSIVLIKSNDKPIAEVIDGQQRLTTLTILLAIIAEMLPTKIGSDFRNYINQPGNIAENLSPKPRLALRERDRAFFKEYVQDPGGIPKCLRLDEQRLSDPQKNIKNNAELLFRKLEPLTDAELLRFGRFIVNRCYLVAVSTPDMHSAYRIFSVLNDRGLDLKPTDILKAELIGGLPENRRDEYTTKWEDAEELLGRDAFSDLISHIRMIYRRAKLQKTVVEEFRNYVLTQEKNSAQFIDDLLVPYSEVYDTLLNANYESAQNPESINSLIEWLLRIDNQDWVPPALLFVKKGNWTEVDLHRFLTSLERLAASLFIRRCTINERIERYARLITAINDDKDLWTDDSPLLLSDDERKATIDAIAGDVYLNRKTRSYILLRLDSWLSCRTATYHHKTITVEHVLPQTIQTGSEWERLWPDKRLRENWVHRLGNLVLLSRRKNSSAQNYDFSKKKDKYFQTRNGVSSFALTTSVLQEDCWTPEVVEKRQKQLMHIAKQNWNL